MPFPPKAARLLSALLTLGLGLPAAAALLAPATLHAQATEPLSLSVNLLPRTYTGAPVAIDPDTELAISPGPASDYTFKVTYSGKTAAPTNAGSYTVKVVATTKALPARSVTATGTLVIAKAPLLVTALDQARLFGAPNPALTLSFDGFLGADTASVLNKRPTVTTPAKTTSPADDYDITVSGGSDNNYEFFGYNTGRLTIIPAYPGTYEALIYDLAAPGPVGKLTLTLPARGVAFTGRLDLAEESAAFSLSGKLVPNELRTGALGSASRKAPDGDTYIVQFSITDDGLSAEILIRDNGSSEDAPLHSIPSLARLTPYTSAARSPAAGAYTFALLEPNPTDFVGLTPAGSGFATATIAANGTLKLSGNFADGAKLTASLLPDADGGHRLFLRPYGSRPNSSASGSFTLTPHPDFDRSDRFCVRVSVENVLFWSKAPKPSGSPDALFPEGFAAISNLIALDPWLPPAKAKPAKGITPAVPAITLAQRLGLAEDADHSGFAFIDHGVTGEDLGATAIELPGAVEFTMANKAVPVLEAPPANPRTWKITSLNTANGRFTGTFKLSDPRSDSTTPYPRNITFQGILRQPPAGETTVGAGYFILKPLPDDFAPVTRSAVIRFSTE